MVPGYDDCEHEHENTFCMLVAGKEVFSRYLNICITSIKESLWIFAGMRGEAGNILQESCTTAHYIQLTSGC